MYSDSRSVDMALDDIVHQVKAGGDVFSWGWGTLGN